MSEIRGSYRLTLGQKIGLGVVSLIFGVPLLWGCLFVLTGAIKLLTFIIHLFSHENHIVLYHQWTEWMSSSISSLAIYLVIIVCTFRWTRQWIERKL